MIPRRDRRAIEAHGGRPCSAESVDQRSNRSASRRPPTTAVPLLVHHFERAALRREGLWHLARRRHDERTQSAPGSGPCAFNILADGLRRKDQPSIGKAHHALSEASSLRRLSRTRWYRCSRKAFTPFS